MKEFKGTKGKWHMSTGDRFLTTILSTETNSLGKEVICIMGGKSDSKDIYNSRLIIHALDMLYLLNDLLSCKTLDEVAKKEIKLLIKKII